ncbi:transposase [Asticcacaulis sp. AC402]|uniref:transposase n=1 Tax=Asticcacaulis sp. AC402 TaxID=1282361 RepID=UPI0003C3B2D1|nr:transposase [Asticcacaulis sp. AC402]ESQ75182.1 hypothetical protein ABAC402_10965 [Asticcacaulis sp. AC402]
MPRAPRLTLAGQAHHVIQRGNNKQAIFFCDADRRMFLADLGEGLANHGCALHAYVLMTNHIHLLVTPEKDEAIGQLMQSLGRRYVGHINRTYGRTGTLWEGRFKSTIVDAQDYVMACYRYIEANPVRAHMLAEASDYRWSSFAAANALGHADPLIIPHEVYRELGPTAEARQVQYRTHFDEGIDEEVMSVLRDTAQRGWVAGSDRFRRQIEAALGRRVDRPVRGRPRKNLEGDGPAAGQTSLL